MATDAVALKRRRTTIKGSCTRIKTFFDALNIAGPDSLSELRVRKIRLDELWKEYDEVQLELEKDSDAETNDRIQFEEAFYTLSARISNVLENSAPNIRVSNNEPHTSNSVATNNHSRIRLPKLNLSTFTGKYDEWVPFAQLFKATIIENGELTNIERFQYLKSSLAGEAADVIQALDVSEQNFTAAWSLLEKRYHKERIIVQRHIQAIMDIPHTKRENYHELRVLLNTVTKHLHSLKSLNRPTDKWDDLLIHIIINKLDSKTFQLWEDTLTSNSFPSINQLFDFLSHRCETLESVHKREGVSTSTTRSILQHSARKSAMTCSTTVTGKCLHCNGDHPLYLCKSFLNLTVAQRINEVKKRNVCLNCIRSKDHQASQCSSGVCKICRGKHNSLLHIPKVTESNNNNTDSRTADSRSKYNSSGEAGTSTMITHSSANVGANYVLLSTAIIYVFNKSGQAIKCRALLDNGSQANLISRDLLSRLNLESKRKNVSITGINKLTTASSQAAAVNIKSNYNAFQTTIECIVTDHITDSIPAVELSKKDIKIPDSIQLADPQFNRPGKIDMLLGADLFWRVMCIGQIKPTASNPTIQKTHLGWILAGSINSQSQASHKINNFFISSNDELAKSLERFWQVEDIISNDTLSPTERACEEHFSKTVARDIEGRFIVSLPIKPNGLQQLGSSKATALRRFQGLEKRLNKNNQLKFEYSRFMSDYVKLGHMKAVDDTEPFTSSCPNFYFPHHCVFKSSEGGRKIRVVFDGSSKTESGVSINDILLVGPTVQDELFSLICRFRTFKYVFSADIVKMYRQVMLNPSQTCMQRILWREDSNQPIKTYELQTVTYGTAAAPFLATRCLKYLADLHKTQYPIGSHSVSHDFYVDDLLTGANTLTEAKEKRDQIIAVLDTGQFKLDKWSSNNASLIQDIPGASQTHDSTAFNAEINLKLLGLLWNPAEDSFHFSVQTNDSNASITKRFMLSEIARMFDPLGLIGPVTVIAKLFIQELWQLQIAWDEEVPVQTQVQWREFKECLPHFHQLKIPRWTLFDNTNGNIQFHGFADASQRAYGACCYLRVQDESGKATITLVASKSRIAPMKSVSLPRLELCAALLLAQISSKILNAFNNPSFRTFFWSDSSITLAWIRSESRRWQTFVANRVGEIQRLTNTQTWHHISTECNPADILSRGATPQDLLNFSLWWQGPHWLQHDEEDWPVSDILQSVDNLPEQRLTTLPNVVKDSSFIDELCSRYSSLGKLVRVVSYCKRFIINSKPNCSRNFGTLSPREIQNSVNDICKLVQEVSFSKEMALLRSSKSLNPTSNILSLTPFCDHDDLLRVGGRLKNANLPYETRHPVLLPKNHPFTNLVIRDTHIRNHHSGVQATIHFVRAKFWPLSLKTSTRKIIRQCITCFKSRPSMSQALMGDLPVQRIQPSRPFNHCGVDFGGPFFIREHKRRGAKLTKCYIAVFVCLAIKAVHIEVVADLSSDCFMASLKRFICRRGRPTCMYSDNGTNFVGANREMREWYKAFQSEQTQRKIKDFVVESQIQWEFIPPHAPHYGGLWEAAIKSCKYHMKRIVGDASLNYDELCTLLCEIESILNSRPITALSNDPNDLQCLTPGHFLIGAELNGIPQQDLLDVKINLLSRWQRIEQLRQHFWQRWSNEYLHQLQTRNKWKLNIGQQLQLGQLVLIQQPGLAPLQWILGRINKVYPDSKGISRSADVRTSKGIVTRPLTKLAILPISM